MRTPRLLLPPLLLAILALLLPPDLLAEDPFQFRGDRLSTTFTKGQERTNLKGHSRIVSGNLEIEADEIDLWGKGFRFASCKGSVVVKDTKKGLVIKADTMEYDRTLKTSRFKGLCYMEDADHGVTVRAGLFDYDETSEKVVIQSGVRIFKGDLVCRSEYALYDRGPDTLELTGLPTVNKKRDVYQAGTIRVNLKTEDVLLEGRVSGTINPDKKKEEKEEEPPVEVTPEPVAETPRVNLPKIPTLPVPKTETGGAP